MHIDNDKLKGCCHLKALNLHGAEFFKALSHPVRLHLVQLLRHGEKCVCELIPAVGMEQSGVSRHLSLLKKEGIVVARKEGQKMMYAVRDERIFQILDLSQEMLRNIWEEKTRIFG